MPTIGGEKMTLEQARKAVSGKLVFGDERQIMAKQLLNANAEALAKQEEHQPWIDDEVEALSDKIHGRVIAAKAYLANKELEETRTCLEQIEDLVLST